MSYEDWIFPPIDAGLVLTGPTAGGKSDLGIALAEKIGGEIVSIDSMAVYQDMNIGTAKPTAEQRTRISHHLLDMVPPTESFSSSLFVRKAHEAIAAITQTGKTPILVGGTPLYLKCLLRGMFLGPPADEAFRKSVAEEVEQVGFHELYKRVQQVDPISAHRIQPTDIRRLTRALEVEKLTGKRLSHWQVQFEARNRSTNVNAFVLSWPRDQIHTRVNARVDAMMNEGLVDEVRDLLTKYSELGRTAKQAVGYKETIAMLEGKFDKAEAVEQIKAHTRQFVRRQEIWFRSTSELIRLPVDHDRIQDVDSLVEQILAQSVASSPDGVS
jgi:tRNA dimethylallyltransferase